MDKAFILQQMNVATYAKKADTKTSFYLVTAKKFPLPVRLSISFDNVITNSTHKGRMVSGDSVVGEIRGEFKKCEDSPLKQHYPFKVNSKIFRKAEFPQLTGYGTLAISNDNGATSQEEGVIVFADMGENIVKLFFFACKCNPTNILSFCELVSEELKKGKA